MKATSSVIIIWVFSALLVSCGREKSLFQRMFVGRTGLDFSNRITESETYNILNFEYVYNGGGTSVGDFNNDGLQDIFFTGNMVNNEMYLNTGDFRFRKISDIAGIKGEDRWCSGSAVVDINNDGWLDLYVCATTYDPSERRANMLFINQGVNADNVPVFKELAEEYGVADTTHTTTAAFFDYDNDGDLDLVLAVNHMDPRLHPNAFRKEGDIRLTINADRLYENSFDEDVDRLRKMSRKPTSQDGKKQPGFKDAGFRYD